VSLAAANAVLTSVAEVEKGLQMDKTKYRCEEHEYEWFDGSKGCPTCLALLVGDLVDAVKDLAEQIISFDPGGCIKGAPYDRLAKAREAVGNAGFSL
jgi:hypothetical protein